MISLPIRSVRFLSYEPQITNDRRHKDESTRQFIERLNAVPLHGGITISKADAKHLERCRARRGRNHPLLNQPEGGGR